MTLVALLDNIFSDKCKEVSTKDRISCGDLNFRACEHVGCCFDKSDKMCYFPKQGKFLVKGILGKIYTKDKDDNNVMCSINVMSSYPVIYFSCVIQEVHKSIFYKKECKNDCHRIRGSSKYKKFNF